MIAEDRPLHQEPVAARSMTVAALLSVTLHGLAVALILVVAPLLTSRTPPELPDMVVELEMVTREPPAASADSALEAEPPPPTPTPPRTAELPPPAPAPPKSRPVRSKAVPALSTRTSDSAPEAVATTAAGDTTAAARDTIAAVSPAPETTAPAYRFGTVETPVPDYPIGARRRGRQGSVLVRLDVGIDGYPEAVAVLESSGNDLLDDAAVSTLRRWRLRPATENGRPVRGRVLVPLTFELR